MNIFLYIFSVLFEVEGYSYECQVLLYEMTSLSLNPSVPDMLKMYFYTGLSINDMGSYDECNALSNTTYALLITPSSFTRLVRGICGPDICDESDYYLTQIPILSNVPISGVIFSKSYQEEHYGTYESGALFMFFLIEFVTAWAILGSIFDYYASENLKTSTIAKLLIAFSVISNGKRLLMTRSQEKFGQKDPLDLLDGMRVMSIGWVVLGHTAVYYLQFVPLVNFDTVTNFFKSTNAIVVYGAFYAVDTFFWMSGFLMTYLFILEIEKTKKITPIQIALVYVHRILRILPLYMFAMCLFWALQLHMGSGPLWVYVDGLISDCNDYWYTNLLFVNNFVPDLKSSNCLGVSWYLANDMQFFMISPIIILLYIKINKAIGWISVFLLCCLNVITAGYVAHHFDLSPARVAVQNGEAYQDYYYYKPYCRVAPYVLGMACGFVVYTYRKFLKDGSTYDRVSLFIAKAQENTYVRFFTAFFGFSLINIVIFVQYQDYEHPGSKGNYPDWNKDDNAAFIAFERVVYGLGISCLILPMLLGHYTKISGFLSLYPWSVLAKFNFTIYLIHLSIIQVIFFSSKQALYYGEYILIRDTVYFYILSLFFAVPIVLLIEMPAMNLERLLFSGLKEKKPAEKALIEMKNDESSPVKIN